MKVWIILDDWDRPLEVCNSYELAEILALEMAEENDATEIEEFEIREN